jgi:hypothetical protein
MSDETARPHSVVFLDPTVEAEPAPVTDVGAPRRPGGLEGKVLGLLANGKVNADRLLALVRDGLATRYALAGVVARTKPDASRPAPAPLLDELARGCDAVVTAVGD